jgi:hypothetical protein
MIIELTVAEIEMLERMEAEMALEEERLYNEERSNG